MEILKKYILFLIFLIVDFFCVNAQNRIEDSFSKSYRYESSGDISSAIAQIKNIGADTYAVNIRLGWLYYQNGEFKTSLSYYTKAIMLRPTSIEARLGYVLPAAKLKLWDNVASQYDAILKVDLYNYKANYYRGLMYYNVGNYKMAAIYFDRIESLYPFDYDIVILSAWNSYYLKDKAKAKLLFQQALLIQPHSQSALEGFSLLK